MLRDPDAADIRSELEDERNQTSPGMAVVMRGISECLVLATILVVCSAVCRSGLNGRQDWYRCEGLTNLEVNLEIYRFVAHIYVVAIDRTFPRRNSRPIKNRKRHCFVSLVKSRPIEFSIVDYIAQSSDLAAVAEESYVSNGES